MLEHETDGGASRKWTNKASVRMDEPVGRTSSGLLEVHVINSEAQVHVLVDLNCPLGVSDIEGVKPEFQLLLLSNLPGILDVCVHRARDGRAAEITTAEERHLARVLIGLLGRQSGPRDARLDPHPRAKHQALQAALVEHIGGINVHDVPTVRAQRPDSLLLAEKSELAFRKVE